MSSSPATQKSNPAAIVAPSPQQLASYRADPAAFVLDLAVSVSSGTLPFGEIAAPHQREWLSILAPSFLAVARGHAPPAPRIWIEATKGSGKDHALAALMLWLIAFSGRPLLAQVAAADQDQAAELEKSARTWLFHNAWLSKRVQVDACRISRASPGRKQIVGPVCEIVAADVAGSHGGRPEILILNEIHAITKWEFARNMLDNASKMPSGLVIAATNAGHIGTDAWKLREIARTSPRWRFVAFTEPAPWLDPAELDEARRRNSTERYARLFRGVWSRGLGDALDAGDVEASVDSFLSPMSSRHYFCRRLERDVHPASFIAGLDLGIRHDHSAVVVLATLPATGRIRLAECRSWAPDPATGKVDLELVERTVLDLHQRFNFSSCRFDPYQAELMAARLRKAGVNMQEMQFSGANLNLMATTLLETFRSRRIDLYPSERLTSDLMRLTIVEKTYGHKLEATRDADGHADTATALAIALPDAISLASSGAGGSWGGTISSTRARLPYRL